MPDKRMHPRIECRLVASIISNGHFFSDRLVNLSEGGAQLEISSPFCIGKDVLLKVHLGAKNLKAIGDVKWEDKSHRRAGVKFLYLPQSLRKYIDGMARKANSCRGHLDSV